MAGTHSSACRRSSVSPLQIGLCDFRRGDARHLFRIHLRNTFNIFLSFMMDLPRRNDEYAREWQQHYPAIHRLVGLSQTLRVLVKKICAFIAVEQRKIRA
jgi:hypothetical protein